MFRPPCKGARDEDPLSTVGPNEAGGDDGPGAADADGPGVVGGISAVGEHGGGA